MKTEVQSTVTVNRHHFIILAQNRTHEFCITSKFLFSLERCYNNNNNNNRRFISNENDK